MREFDYKYRGGEVFLPDALTSATAVSNVLFTSTTILGPAAVVIDPSCNFVGPFTIGVLKEVDLESYIWPAPEEQMIGVIGMYDCEFRSCRWEMVGFVVADEDDRSALIERATIARMEWGLGDS